MTRDTSEAQPLSITLNGEPKQHLLALTFGRIGVVYGDIGTSPLYALREAVHAAQDTEPLTQATVLGVLSLILWSLIVVVTLKYVLILLCADNNGEGGTLFADGTGAPSLRPTDHSHASVGHHRRLNVPW
jgi:KUP system potassium uptake protein